MSSPRLEHPVDLNERALAAAAIVREQTEAEAAESAKAEAKAEAKRLKESITKEEYARRCLAKWLETIGLDHSGITFSIAGAVEPYSHYTRDAEGTPNGEKRDYGWYVLIRNMEGHQYTGRIRFTLNTELSVYTDYDIPHVAILIATPGGETRTNAFAHTTLIYAWSELCKTSTTP